MNRFVPLRVQRGISLTGLIVVIAILGVVGIFAAKVLPTYSEYVAIKHAIETAKATGGGVREIQSSFNKAVEVSDITSITAKDLVVSKETGETEISFAYEKKIPIAGNTSLLIEYSGTTAKNGVVAEKPAQ
jgi:Tfp pilus assembly protein PilE